MWHSVIFMWGLPTHRFHGMCMLSRGDVVLIYLQSCDELMWLKRWKIRFCLDICDDTWQTTWTHIRTSGILKACVFEGCGYGDGACIESRLLGVHAGISSCSHWKLKVLKQHDWSAVLQVAEIFWSHAFLCSLTCSLTSKFLQKSIKGLAKSPFRQRSHSWMQTPGLALSN